MKRTTMKTGARRRTTGLVSLAAAATLVLSACGGEDEANSNNDAGQEQEAQNDEANNGADEASDETGDDAAEDTAGEDEVTEEPAEDTEAPADDEATEEPAEDTEAPADGEGSEDEGSEDAGGEAGGGAAGDFTTAEAGTALGFGESATLHVQDREEGHEYYAFGYVESTVTGIEEGDASFFEQFDDTEEYEGMTPYFISAEHEVLFAEGYESGTNLEPTFEGVLDDGTPAQGLIVISMGGGVEECQEDRVDEWVTGATASTCDIALAPEGQSVTSAVWTGDREIDGGWDENPYMDDPITWE